MEDYYLIRIEAVATNQDGSFDHAEQTLSFSTPTLRITGPQTAKVNEEFLIQAEFDNPLEIPLRKCYFIYEGTRVERKVITLKDVAVGGKVAIRLAIKTKFPRNETIVISFVSSSLNDVLGSIDIEITDDKPKRPLYPHFTYVTEK
ncbi:hypothetical protein B4U80_12525 [Leptotrombidium deliense]|uniref:Hemocyte protein-glutamine gamma-glutamyltransferase-like protein n=1 Tax=Leptotrombidium deliense TaxID=299467 RepID=A0A443SSH0_9ACAR|nr:hypothetical protein B4U80_12525 [Leptotrombidium deliense]